jgi:hypothetical protein
MQLSRRDFLSTASAAGFGILIPSFGPARNSFTDPQMILDQEFVNLIKSKIEKEILPRMEKEYLHCGTIFDDNYEPDLKYLEKIVNFYDYQATGISVLAILASKGNTRANILIKKIQNNMRYYQQNIIGIEIDGSRWDVPLRRLLLHIALAYKELAPLLSEDDKKLYTELVEQQVPLAIAHNENFFPGKNDLYMTTNNHTAIFMQGIYYCGKVFSHNEWVDLTLDFANRMYDCVNPDGYFEEMSNKEREGGPSLVYTRLTLGCLYDVLDGRENSLQKFIKAGDFYRSFINYDYKKIPIADERTNDSGKGIEYGLALHSLTARGRYFIVDNLASLDFSKLPVEDLSVIYHEINLMKYGNCEMPENRVEGNSRIALPLGIVRKNGFTAGLSALLALNRHLYPRSDYHLDQQDMVYLSHNKGGIILTGYKSKNDQEFSTFRIGNDAYTVSTGELLMGDGWAEANLYYKTFRAKIRWEISDMARLILTTDSDKVITTCFPVTDEKFVQSGKNYQIDYLNGFSPYTKNNVEGKIKVLNFEWEKRLVIEFNV